MSKKTLILMRHAKSCWDSPSLADHDRPLNDRGKASAKALGHWLYEKKFIPQEALVSTSSRTQETFSGLDLEINPTLKKELYHASSDVLLENIEQARQDKFLLISHNPGIGELAFRLARMIRHLPSHPRFVDFPTGATLIIQWNTDSWKNIDYSQGEIIEFIVPRDLL